MSNQPTTHPNLSQIVQNYFPLITPDELIDILEAVKALKLGSGWGQISIQYLNSDVDNIEIKITRKNKRKKPV